VPRTTLKCTVSGRVQGVYYRASTAERAAELCVDGWVRNRADGNVELVVSGDADKVEALIAWLWHGPPAAEVVAVALEEHEQAVEPGFRIAR
jgi:acylphosphatase